MSEKMVEKSVDVYDKFQDRVMEYIRLTNSYNTWCDPKTEYTERMCDLGDDIIDLFPVIRSLFEEVSISDSSDGWSSDGWYNEELIFEKVFEDGDTP